MFKKAFSLVLLSALLAAGTASAGMAPLSPEFLKWREEQRGAVHTAGETAKARNYGVRPSPLNLAHLASNPVKVADALPVSFDLRTLNVVPPIRHQSSWGTCWTFATMSAVETNYLMQVTGQGTDKYITSALPAVGSTPEEVDLSEMHLAWFSFMGNNLPQRLTVASAKDIRSPTGNEVLNEGGFAGVPTLVMARGKGWGPVTEASLPYISKSFTEDDIAKELGFDPKNQTQEQQKQVADELARRTNEYCKTNLSAKKPSDYASVLRLKEAAYVVTLNGGDDTEAAYLFKYNRDAIKQLIRDKGALYIAYSSGGDINKTSLAVSGTSSSYYFSGEDGSHAVAVIGWDDDYPAENFEADKNGRAPTTNGAWLIRNSWGKDEDYYPDGCFWMSYEQAMSFGTAFSMAPADSSLTTYTHSDLGWCLSWGLGDNGDKAFYGASVFKAGDKGGSLKEIGFYTTDNNASAEFSVYVYDGKPTAANLTAGRTAAASKTVSSVPYAGYHTVTLDSPVSVKAGQYFSIVQKASNPSFNYPIAMAAKLNSWSDFAEFHDGEGYFSSNGTEWTDGVQAQDNGKSQPITPCIYAFMSDTAADDEGEETESQTIEGIAVERLDNFAGNINVDFDANERLNSESARTGRKLTLTLAGTDGNPVAEGQDFTLYLLYTNDVLHWAEQSASKWGVDYPSGDVLPLYPAGHKPDLFLTVDLGDDDLGYDLEAELPAYGPFEVTTAADGKITLDVDDLVYADGYESEKAGEKANIPTGYQALLYFQRTDTATSACGMVEDINVTSGGKSSGSSSSGCDAGLGGWAVLCLAGLAALLRKR